MLAAWVERGLLICPACRGLRDGTFHAAPLRRAQTFREDALGLLHATLACSACPAVYPVVDGVAVVSRDLPAHVRREERALWWREDLPPALGDLLRRAYADDQDPCWRRQMLATYAASFRGAAGAAWTGAAARSSGAPAPAAPFERALLDAAREAWRFIDDRLALAAHRPGLRAVELGSGLGAPSLTLAARGAEVLALDADVGALRLLRRLAAGEAPAVPEWRHGGDDFVPAALAAPERSTSGPVVTVAGDAIDPPLGPGTADVVVALNVLDNVSDPVLLLRQAHALLVPGGRLLLCTPYDWSPRATPAEARLGQTLRAAPDDPDPARALRALLAGQRPDLAPGVTFEVTHEVEALPWVLFRHARSAHVFRCHWVEARRV